MVEHLLAKERVAGSIPVFRSTKRTKAALDKGGFLVERPDSHGFLTGPRVARRFGASGTNERRTERLCHFLRLPHGDVAVGVSRR